MIIAVLTSKSHLSKRRERRERRLYILLQLSTLATSLFIIGARNQQNTQHTATREKGNEQEGYAVQLFAHWPPWPGFNLRGRRDGKEEKQEDGLEVTG